MRGWEAYRDGQVLVDLPRFDADVPQQVLSTQHHRPTPLVQCFGVVVVVGVGERVDAKEAFPLAVVGGVEFYAISSLRVHPNCHLCILRANEDASTGIHHDFHNML